MEKKNMSQFLSSVECRECDFEKLIIGAILDDTENKLLHDKLLEVNKRLHLILGEETKKRKNSEKRYKELFDGVPYYIIVSQKMDDERFSVVEMNSPTDSFLGYSRDDVLGLCLEKVCHILSRNGEIKILNGLKELKNISFDTKLYKKNGEKNECRINAYIGELDNKETIYLNIIDRSKEERLQKKIAKVTDTLRETYKIAKIGSWHINLKNNRFNWSEELLEITKVVILDEGGTLETFVGRFENKDERGRFLELIKSCSKDGDEFEIEHLFSCGDGSSAYFKTRGRHTLSENGFPLIFGYSQDITKQKEIEKKQKQQEQLLIQQSKMASMGNMLAAISHQLRQPLNGISLLASMLEDDGHEKQKGAIEKIFNQIDFMNNTINGFRNFFKQDRKKEPFDIKGSIEEVISLLQHQLRNNNIFVELFVEDKVFTSGFKNDFKQVVLNLITNAKDAILERSSKEEIGKRQPGVIKIASTIIGNRCILSFEDNGGGIKKENLSQIFNEHFTTKGEDGTGIGLHLCKLIVEEKMGGKIVVRNVEKGAEFIITLPLV